MKEKKIVKNDTSIIKAPTVIKAAAIIIVCFAVFFVLVAMISSGNASLIDEPIRNAVISMRTAWLTPIIKAITYMGNWQFITAVCIILIIIPKTRRTYGAPLSIGALFVSLANKGIKAIVMRPRPEQAMFLIEQGGWSFPSGHSITSMFFYGMAIWLVRKNMLSGSNMISARAVNILTVVLAMPMILIGISRIYLGVHYPTDVLAGWSLGIVTIVVISQIVTLFSTVEDVGRKKITKK